MNNERHTQRTGRPREEGLTEVILKAARRLTVELGYERMTTAQIANEAGVSKQTLYRRWPTKADLVLEAMLEFARSNIDSRTTVEGDAQIRLTDFLKRTFNALQEMGPAVRSLMAWAQTDPVFRETFREKFINPRRRALAALLRDAFEPEQKPAEERIETAVALLYGAMWYRLLLDEPINEKMSLQLADMVISGLRSGPSVADAPESGSIHVPPS